MSTKLVSKYVQSTKAERIAQLNDRLRRMFVESSIVITQGVQSLDEFELLELMRTLARWDDFDEANDPYGEHDFGGMDLFGAELLWKIDYYSPDMFSGSEDPADPLVTHRVLTVLLAEEY